MAAEADGVRSLARGARVPRVLVVDDEDNLRELMELTLVGMGLDVDVAADLAHARRLVMEQKYALCLTDMRLPDGNGLELVNLITSRSPDTPVAVITAYGSAENAVAALKAGAFDYLAKPVGLDALRALIRAALQLPTPGGADEVQEALMKKARGSETGGLLLGASPAVEAVRSSIARMARSMAPVAISGESGSGKELAARLIHQMGARPQGPFIAVNCGAIPENLMESEFFGYRKGAFTGADTDRTGFFMAANGGTLFLDEVADLPLAMQVKLLRAIQEKRIRKVGSVTEDPVDARIISATHQDLARCVADGRFRQDLFYRLNVIELRMPPLRERLEDIGVLAEAILVRLAERAPLASVPKLSSVTLRFLESYRFPGNVRELENILERALAFSDGKVINVENLGLRPIVTEDSESERASPDEPARHGPADAQPARPLVDAEGVPRSLPDYLDQLEREAIRKALEKTGQNRTAAARLLGITFRALRYRMQRLEIN
jgi:two-component system response regulator PilR (NtrC family)